MLLAAGATLDAKDANGSTAAQLAEYWYGISVIVISSSSCMTCMMDLFNTDDSISGSCQHITWHLEFIWSSFTLF